MGAKDDYGLLEDLAKRLGLDETESDNFISSSMKRLGHRMSTLWEDAEGSGDSGSGDFFSRRRESRNVGGSGRRDNSSDWQYRTGS